MAKSGYKKVLTLRKYVNGVATDQVKDNDLGSVDYVSPLYDPYFCGGTTTTTTSTTTTTTTTTSTNPRERYGDLIAIAVSSGPGDDCSNNPSELRTGVLYVSLKDFNIDFGGGVTKQKGIVLSNLNFGSLSKGKYVLDNANRKTIFDLQTATLGGIPIYQASEGYYHEKSLYNTAETIFPFVTTNNGVYTVAKASLLVPGENDRNPNFHIQVVIEYDHTINRNVARFNFCINNDSIDNGDDSGPQDNGIEFEPYQ